MVTREDVAVKLVTVLAIASLVRNPLAKAQLLDMERLAHELMDVDAEMGDVFADEAGAEGLMMLSEEGHDIDSPELKAQISQRATDLALEAIARHEAKQKQADPFNPIRFDVVGPKLPC